MTEPVEKHQIDIPDIEDSKEALEDVIRQMNEILIRLGEEIAADDDVVWDDIRVVPGAFKLGGANDPSAQNWQPGGAGTTFKVYKFQENDEVFFTVQIPHSYEEGTDIEPHIHWTPADRGNEEIGTIVMWKLDYSWANQQGVFAPSATVSMSATCSGVDSRHQYADGNMIYGAGKTISSMLVCRLWRSATGDTWAGTTSAQSPAVLEFDFHFQLDTRGSR